MCIGRLLASEYSRHIADALKDSLTELRKDDEMRMSQYVHTELSEWSPLTQYCLRITTTFQEELSAFREGGQKQLAQLVFPPSSRLV